MNIQSYIKIYKNPDSKLLLKGVINFSGKIYHFDNEGNLLNRQQKKTEANAKLQIPANLRWQLRTPVYYYRVFSKAVSKSVVILRNPGLQVSKHLSVEAG